MSLMSEQKKKWTLDALAALSNAISDSKHIMKSSPIAGLDVLEILISNGFTITRQPAMTDAELEATAKTIATMAFSVSDIKCIDAIARDIVNLAKKYRGVGDGL